MPSPEKELFVKFWAILVNFDPACMRLKFEKIIIFHQNTHFKDTFVPLSFQDDKDFFIHKNFQKIGYYSGFYSFLRHKNWLFWILSNDTGQCNIILNMYKIQM